jgi:hypothetical protein
MQVLITNQMALVPHWAHVLTVSSVTSQIIDKSAKLCAPEVSNMDQKHLDFVTNFEGHTTLYSSSVNLVESRKFLLIRTWIWMYSAWHKARMGTWVDYMTVSVPGDTNHILNSSILYKRTEQGDHRHPAKLKA